MENKKKESITSKLMSSDLKIARSAIKLTRKEGKLADIPGIIEALRGNEIEQIRKEIKGLLCDIQLSGAEDYIVEAVKDAQNESILSDLLSVCWESKQNFKEYLEVFVSAFLNSDYKASLEAFTVIEKIFMDNDYSDSKLISTIDIIKTSYSDLSENKRELALVLIDSLESLKEK